MNLLSLKHPLIGRLIPFTKRDYHRVTRFNATSQSIENNLPGSLVRPVRSKNGTTCTPRKCNLIDSRSRRPKELKSDRYIHIYIYIVSRPSLSRLRHPKLETDLSIPFYVLFTSVTRFHPIRDMPVSSY